MTELAIAVWAVGIAAWLAFVVYVYLDRPAVLAGSADGVPRNGVDHPGRRRVRFAAHRECARAHGPAVRIVAGKGGLRWWMPRPLRRNPAWFRGQLQCAEAFRTALACSVSLVWPR